MKLPDHSDTGAVWSGSPSHIRYGVAAMLCAAAIIAYMQRNSIGAAEEAIRLELNLNKDITANIISIFFLSYALLQVPTGWLAKTVGVRYSLTWFAVLFSVLASVFSFAKGSAAMIAARLGMGIGQAGLFPAAVQAIAAWIPESRRGTVTGLLGGSMSVGGALGVTMMGAFLDTSGWRFGFLFFSLLGIVWALIFFCFYRNRPSEHLWANDAEAALIADRAQTSGVKEAKSEDAKPLPQQTRRRYSFGIQTLTVSALCSQQVCRGAAQIFYASWFATFLRETRGVQNLEVGFLNSLPLWAIVIGSPVGGIISDWVLAKTGSRRAGRQGVAAFAMTMCGILIFAAYPIQSPLLAVLVISMGSFFAAFAGPCAYTSTIEIGGRHTAVVFGLMNMFGNLGAWAFAKFVPRLLQEDPNVPGSGNWDLVLFVFGGLYFAAALFWLFTNTNVTVGKNDDLQHTA